MSETDDDDDPRSWRTLDEAIERAEANHARHAARADDPRLSLTKPEITRSNGPIPALAAVLEFEEKWPRHRGSKEDAIRKTFRLSTPRYYQILFRMIDTREALELNPQLVNRLREQREARTTARASRSLRRTT